MCHISNIDNTHDFVVLLQHTKTTETTKNPANMHSSNQLLQQSAQQIHFSSSDAPLWEVFLSTAAMGVGIHIYKNRDSHTFTCNVLTAQKRE